MSAKSIAGTITIVKMDELETDPSQPRHYFDTEKQKELCESIRESGVITPLLYREDGERKIIVAGERRYRAARDTGLNEVPAQLVTGDYQTVALAENMQRNSLLPMEEALAIKKILDTSGLQQEDVAQKLGKAPSTLSEMLKPSDLPQEIQDAALASSLWSRNKLLRLAKTKDKQAQSKLFQTMRENIAKKEQRANSQAANQEGATQEATDAHILSVSPKTKKSVVGFKNDVAKLRGRVQKHLSMKANDAMKREVEQELRDLVADIQSFLEAKTE